MSGTSSGEPMVPESERSDPASREGLNMVVCIKQVPHAENLVIDPVTKTLKRDEARAVINPPDENGCELAFRLRDEHGGHITVITMGPPSAEHSLREILARGADRAVHLCDRRFAGADTYPTSLTLAAAIIKLDKERPVDLIICGEETTDSSTAHVGPGIAEHLAIPQATFISSLVYDREGTVFRARRTLEGAYEVIEFVPPAVVSVCFNMNTPRRATLRGKVNAKRVEIPIWTADDLGLPKDWIGFRGSPTVVATVHTEQSESRACEFLSGKDPADTARMLIERLIAKDVLP